jgi:hypothetical protein
MLSRTPPAVARRHGLRPERRPRIINQETIEQDREDDPDMAYTKERYPHPDIPELAEELR